MNLRTKSLNFLLEWINKNNIPHIRKGMVEDLEKFVTDQLADAESNRIVNSMTHSPMKEQLEEVKEQAQKES